jgi:type IV secretion system protein VirB1
LASIAKVESGDDVLTVGENGQKHLVFRPLSRQAAEALAARLIASGANVDLGLTQINSRNLGWLRLSVGEAFDPCANLAAAAKIIDRGYNAALRAGPQNRPLLQTAFSLYNTGDAERGLENGYVDKVEAARRE